MQEKDLYFDDSQTRKISNKMKNSDTSKIYPPFIK